jgi:hypothetical protein
MGKSTNKKKAAEKRKTSTKEKLKYFLVVWIPLLIVFWVVPLFIPDKCAPLDTLEIIEVKDVVNEKVEAVLVHGIIKEGEGTFVKDKVTFNEDTGVAEIRIYSTKKLGFMADNNFVAYVDTNPENVEEVWLVYEDLDGNITDRQQLDWNPDLIQ